MTRTERASPGAWSGAWSPDRRREHGRRAQPRGLTLIETALATIIVGVAVLALVSAQTVFHQKNAWSSYATIAMQLGNEIREMTLNLPRHDPVTGNANWGPETDSELHIGDFDDIDDFDGDEGNGMIFSAADGNGPINARREVIANMTGWEQEIRVRNVDPFDITVTRPDGSTDALLIEVIVRFTPPSTGTPEEVTRVSWIAPR